MLICRCGFTRYFGHNMLTILRYITYGRKPVNGGSQQDHTELQQHKVDVSQQNEAIDISQDSDSIAAY